MEIVLSDMCEVCVYVLVSGFTFSTLRVCGCNVGLNIAPISSTTLLFICMCVMAVMVVEVYYLRRCGSSKTLIHL